MNRFRPIGPFRCVCCNGVKDRSNFADLVNKHGLSVKFLPNDGDDWYYRCKSCRDGNITRVLRV